MAPVPLLTSLLFRTGRTPGPILAVVLHEYNSGIEFLDQEMDRCPRPRPTGPRGCHNSFHYGIGSNSFHQYIDTANTAWGFGLQPVTCPVPPCPVDACASCTGLTADQYNPDLDGNPATPPAFVPGFDGTANSQVIHVALAIGNYNLLCCEKFLQNRVAYNNLVASLAFIFDAAGLTPTSGVTLLVHCQELNCLDLDQLVEDIIAYVPPEPIVPCACISDSPAGAAAICAALSNAAISAVPAISALGQDCQWHPIAATDVTITGVDTASVDITVTEAPANTFTISADVISIPPAALCAAVAAVPVGPIIEGDQTVFVLTSGCEQRSLNGTFFVCDTVHNAPVAPITPQTVLFGYDSPADPSDCAVYSVADLITDVAITATDSPCLNLDVVEGPDNTFVISGNPIISPAVGNQLVCNPDGLFVPVSAPPLTNCNFEPDPFNSYISTQNWQQAEQIANGYNFPFTIVSGAGTNSCPFFVAPPDTCPDVSAPLGGQVTTNDRRVTIAGDPTGNFFSTLDTDIPGLVNENAETVNATYILEQAEMQQEGNVLVRFPTVGPASTTVEPPGDSCGIQHVFIKNAGTVPMTVNSTGGELIDGQPFITLDPVVVGGYPFGNNGGEAVHLVWLPVAGQWFVF